MTAERLESKILADLAMYLANRVSFWRVFKYDLHVTLRLKQGWGKIILRLRGDQIISDGCKWSVYESFENIIIAYVSDPKYKQKVLKFINREREDDDT